MKRALFALAAIFIWQAAPAIGAAIGALIADIGQGLEAGLIMLGIGFAVGIVWCALDMSRPPVIHVYYLLVEPEPKVTMLDVPYEVYDA